MISRFFIDRPIFAAVLSIVITLAGAISVFTLPLAQFPNISPPTVAVTCQFPGASAQDVADSVAAPIEEQVNGVENMMYMSSSCTNDGSYNLQVTFRHGVDLDMAQVLVQNRIALALPRLPEVIRQTGVTTKKRSPDILMGFSVNCPSGRYDQLYLSNYVIMQVKEELARLDGVSDVMVFGQRDYSMRIWVDPSLLASRNLTAGDVVRSIREQNQSLATGQIGQPPTKPGQQLQITLNTLGRLESPEQFGNIVLRALPDGRTTHLKDVARIELGAKNEDTSCRFNGKDTAFIAIFQTPDANALECRQRVMAKMDELSKGFPEGVVHEVAFDTTPYTSESINEVFKTLRDAIILVALVVLVFLQNWRSAIIPLVAVPVAIIGTFAAMRAINFSLNNLTLFGLVLAIGIVVDDAIVVVEAVEHHMELGLGPREATIKAMEQVSGPVIAVGCVLSAVFVPCAFISGITGQFFRQFALTIAVSTLISAFNSLTLSPALTALLLRPRPQQDRETGRQGDKETGRPGDKETTTGGHPPLPRAAFVLLGGWLGWLGWEFLAPQVKRLLTAWAGPDSARLLVSLSPCLLVLLGAALGWLAGGVLNTILGSFFRAFNAGFRLATNAYTRSVGMLLRVSAIVLLVYGGLLGLTYLGFTNTPKGFIPTQDMGYLLVNVQLPDSSSMERTEKVMKQVYKIAKETKGVRHVTTIAGQSFVLNAIGSNFGSVFLNLDDYAQRRDPQLHSDVIANKLRQRFGNEILDAQVAVFGPPPVRGAGRAGGFAIMIEDRGDVGSKSLQRETERLVREGNALRIDESGELRKEEYGRPGKALVDELLKKDQVRTETVLTGADASKADARLDELVAKKIVSGPDAERIKRYRAHFNDTGPIQDKEALRGQARVDDLIKAGHVKGELPLTSRDAARSKAALDALIAKGALKEEDRAAIERYRRYVNGRPPLLGLFSVFRANVPQLKIEPDMHEMAMKGVNTRDFSDTLQVYEGSLYVNDFNLFGRTWQVIVQAEARERVAPEDIPRLKVRNLRGGMVPLGAVANVRPINGPLVLTRYNMYPAASINGTAAQDISSFQAIDYMQWLAEQELPKAMKYEWTDMSYLELLAGDTATVIFGFAVIMVFLVLAALYESWSLPLAVILVVPMCLLSALAGVNLAHLDVNIFTRIGFVVLVGLASKNAILIVEFAKLQREAGVSRRNATLEAVKLRLRPIIMTSLAFILGVLPLVLGHGAGSEMRRALGVAVFGGMIGVTLFGIFLTPVFFYVINWLSESRPFTAARVQRTGALLLDVMTLGVRRVPALVGRLRQRRRPTVRPTVPTTPATAGRPDGIVTTLPQAPAHPDGYVKEVR